MRVYFFFSFTFLMACNSKLTTSDIKVDYPETQKIDQKDEYFGVEIADPYRWLENDTSDQTAEWVKTQNKCTDGYLSQIPFKSDIAARLEKLWNYPKSYAPFKRGEYYYYFKNDGLQNQNVLYRSSDLGQQEELFLDPNTLKEDGTAALGSYSFSKDAQYFAYAINDAGSDWQTIYIKDVKTGELLEEQLKWAKFTGMMWKGQGFYYSKYDIDDQKGDLSTQNQGMKVYYHALNTTQSEDVLIFEKPETPLHYLFSSISKDEQHLFINESKGTSGEKLYYKNLKDRSSTFTALNNDFDNDHYFVGNDQDRLFVYTNLNAPNYKIIELSAKDPSIEHAKDFIVQDQEMVLKSFELLSDKVILTYMKDAHQKVFVHDLSGKRLHEIQLPAPGSVWGFDGDQSSEETYFSFSSFLYPLNIYKFNLTSFQSDLYKQAKIDFEASNYQTTQVFYKSKDGTEVPMFLTHKKGLQLDGTNPTYLYGYGGFNISITPSFKVTMLPFLEQGGIYAVANIRGGGEYGEKWHKQGMLLNKQNVFDDFIYAAEYLIDQKYTSTEKLAISGRSNGGLLVGACMTQRPDLFAVALPGVGVLDMLRYHKFTVGWGWAVEYGSSDEREHFENLIQYSPLHNIKDSMSYPATLVTTADHDDRVVPAHSFKFISELQSKQTGLNPCLIRIDINAGHGAGKPTEMIIDEWADIWAFTLFNMNETYAK